MRNETPIALLSKFESAARRDFEERLVQVRREIGTYLTTVPRGGERFDVRELTRELMTMPDMERYVLLGRVMPRTDGPASLEGLEAIRSFIGHYMLDDGECVVVVEPEPENIEDDVYYATALDCLRADADGDEALLATAPQRALEETRAREKPFVVVQIRSEHDRPARAAEVMVALRHNRGLEERREAAFSDLMELDEYSGPGGP